MSGVVFGWEPLKTIFGEPNWPDLIAEHWAELGVHRDRMPLDPDYKLCLMLEENKRFFGYTARSGGLLVGYMGFIVQPHLHYRTTLTAVEDLFMLSPAYRKGLTGYRMFSSAIAKLKEMGVKRVILHDKVHWSEERQALGQPGMDVLFQRLGFEQTDRIWSRML